MSKKSVLGILSLCMVLVFVSITSVIVLIPMVSTNANVGGKIYTLSGNGGSLKASSTDASPTDAGSTDTGSTGASSTDAQPSDNPSGGKTESSPTDAASDDVAGGVACEKGAYEIDFSDYDDVCGSVLTDSEKEAGYQVLMQVGAADKEISDEEKALFEKNKPEGFTIAKYMDITLYKVDPDGNMVQIHELKNPISFVITLPEDLIEAGREFITMRNHEDKIDCLVDSDDDDETVTVISGKFSTYAVAYRNAETPDDSTKNTGDVMNTPENSIRLMILTLLAAVAIVTIVALNKRISEYQKLKLD